MHDQVCNLQARGIAAYSLSGGASVSTKNEVRTRMQDENAESWLLYVTPEKISSSTAFMSQLNRAHDLGLFKRIAIDEAHCCSTWGQDFRPDYKALTVLKNTFSDVPILAVTATSTPNVTKDIIKILKMSNPVHVKNSLDRRNLEFCVLPKKSGKELVGQIRDCIVSEFGTKKVCGIIYCYSKKDTEDLAEKLVCDGFSCSAYHAGMTEKQREKVHDDWLDGKIFMITATIAFGMGIDKPDVRFVFHHSMSKSLENYYQEAGRAGRDGKRSLLV